LFLALGASTAIAPHGSFAQERAQRGAEDPLNPCGPVYHHEGYGPFDYRTDRDKLKIVEDFHFTPKVEMLKAGQSGYIGSDLSYTLRSFPNHHRALVSLIRYSEKTRSQKPDNMQYSVECYFDRAIRFRPDDTKVRSIYAQYLHANKRTAEALKQLEAASTYAADSGNAHYNIGVVYYQLGKYDEALANAHKAKQLGVAEGQLEALLRKSGHWKDPSQ